MLINRREGGEGAGRSRFLRRDEARHAIRLSIDSIEISAEISASGTVSLLGSGGAVAGKGGISFTLTQIAATAGVPSQP